MSSAGAGLARACFVLCSCTSWADAFNAAPRRCPIAFPLTPFRSAGIATMCGRPEKEPASSPLSSSQEQERRRVEATRVSMYVGDDNEEDADDDKLFALPDVRALGFSDDSDGERMQGAMLMLAVAILWGSNFPAVKATMEAGLPGTAASALRFSVAALALMPLMFQPPSGGAAPATADGAAQTGSRAPLPQKLVIGGLECGAWLALGYIAQAAALQHLPAGAVAFLASLQVVFVPLALSLTGGGAFTPRLALAASLCVGGVGLLEMGGVGAGGAGAADALGGLDLASPMVSASLLALLQPVGFGTSYLRIEALMKEFPEYGLQLSSLQLTSNALIAICWCAFDATVLSTPGAFDLSALHDAPAIIGVLYTGLISTALTVLLQTKALGKLSATDSSVIVATEPLWAAGFAAILLGEVLDQGAMLGGALILLGCLSNTLLPPQLWMTVAAGGAPAASGDRKIGSAGSHDHHHSDESK
jgi:drug/metabolite transporter (DMT)-like permease